MPLVQCCGPQEFASHHSRIENVEVGLFQYEVLFRLHTIFGVLLHAFGWRRRTRIEEICTDRYYHQSVYPLGWGFIIRDWRFSAACAHMVVAVPPYIFCSVLDVRSNGTKMINGANVCLWPDRPPRQRGRCFHGKSIPVSKEEDPVAPVYMLHSCY